MSSIVAVKCSQGFVISTDSIVFKYVTDSAGNITGKIKGITHKMFQIRANIVVVGLGNWNTYFPIFNKVARMTASDDIIVNELRHHALEFSDARIYIFSNLDGTVTCDIVENNEVRINRSGAVMYPESVINSMFLSLYESSDAMRIRESGMLGIAALVHAYNQFAASLCSDIAAPFDTILFTNDGIFDFSGGSTHLPVGDFV